MKIVSSRFECSAYRAEDEPRPTGPAAIFLGRSNVGKSSLMNCLTGIPGLARTSCTPGRTQSVNFYRINGSVHFVDLPGYGYAEAPDRLRRSWRAMVNGFLDRWRERIAIAVLLLDARHEPTPLDGVMRDWLEASEVPFVVVATKADKLSGNERSQRSRSLLEWVGESDGPVTTLLVSARTGLGIRELWKVMDRALGKAQPADRGKQWISAN